MFLSFIGENKLIFKALVAALIVVMGILASKIVFFQNLWAVIPIFALLAISPFLIGHCEEKNKIEKGWLQLISYSYKITAKTRTVIPGLKKHIEFSMIHDVGKFLYEKSHLIIKGGAGVGKTGFVYSLSQRHKNLQFVFIDCRDISSCKTIQSIEEKLGITEYKLLKLLNEKAQRNKIIFVIDQCDSIWRVSNLEGLFNLINYLLKIKCLQIILICRNEESEGIKEYLDERTNNKVESIVIGELEKETVLSILKEFELDQPSEEIINISRNLFNLSILGEIYESSGTEALTGITTFADYFEKYRLILEAEVKDNPTNLKVTTKAAELAKQTLVSMSGICEIDINLPVDERVLLGRDVIRRETENSIRCKFSHEKLRDYFYCYYTICVENKEFEIIQEELEDQFSLIAPSMNELCLKFSPERSAQLVRML